MNLWICQSISELINQSILLPSIDVWTTLLSNHLNRRLVQQKAENYIMSYHTTSFRPIRRLNILCIACNVHMQCLTFVFSCMLICPLQKEGLRELEFRKQGLASGLKPGTRLSTMQGSRIDEHYQDFLSQQNQDKHLIGGNYSEIIYIGWTFNFMYFLGSAIHEFKIPIKFLIHFSNIAYNLKSMNSSVHELA